MYVVYNTYIYINYISTSLLEENSSKTGGTYSFALRIHISVVRAYEYAVRSFLFSFLLENRVGPRIKLRNA